MPLVVQLTDDEKFLFKVSCMLYWLSWVGDYPSVGTVGGGQVHMPFEIVVLLR